MVSVDLYVNETTRHADVILPPTGPLGARPLRPDLPHLRRPQHRTLEPRRSSTDRMRPATTGRSTGTSRWPWTGGAGRTRRTPDAKPRRPVDEARLRTPPAQLIDALLAIQRFTGPVGRGLARRPRAESTWDRCRPQLPQRLATSPSASTWRPRSSSIRWRPPARCCGAGSSPRGLQPQPGPAARCSGARIRPIRGGITRSRARPSITRPPAPAPGAPIADARDLLLIGRRHQRDNNSWMHNQARLVRGRPRHQLLVNPADLLARGISLRRSGARRPRRAASWRSNAWPVTT